MAKKPMMKDKEEKMKGKEEKMPSNGNGLTAGQKKLPPALQAAILKKKKK
jgi:hypothetical protein